MTAPCFLGTHLEGVHVELLGNCGVIAVEVDFAVKAFKVDVVVDLKAVEYPGAEL